MRERLKSAIDYLWKASKILIVACLFFVIYLFHVLCFSIALYLCFHYAFVEPITSVWIGFGATAFLNALEVKILFDYYARIAE